MRAAPRELVRMSMMGWYQGDLKRLSMSVSAGQLPNFERSTLGVGKGPPKGSASFPPVLWYGHLVCVHVYTSANGEVLELKLSGTGRE